LLETSKKLPDRQLELVELRLLTAALDAFLTVLRLERPALEALGEPTDPPTLQARRVLAWNLLEQRRAQRRTIEAGERHPEPFVCIVAEAIHGARPCRRAC
jgi:hypothetical protein